MLDALKKKVANEIKNAIDIIKLPEDERNERLEICKSCDQLGKMDFCKLCGCYMPAKTYMPATSCPLNKWTSVLIKN